MILMDAIFVVKHFVHARGGVKHWRHRDRKIGEEEI